jgi:hypothetical protein
MSAHSVIMKDIFTYPLVHNRTDVKCYHENRPKDVDNLLFSSLDGEDTVDIIPPSWCPLPERETPRIQSAMGQLERVGFLMGGQLPPLIEVEDFSALWLNAVINIRLSWRKNE